VTSANKTADAFKIIGDSLSKLRIAR